MSEEKECRGAKDMPEERERIGSNLRARELGEALSKGRISYPSDDVVERYYSKYGSIEDEYLVDGAILTCSKATTEMKYILEQKFDCWESGSEVQKKRTRLKVFGNDISIVGAPLATVKAHIVEDESIGNIQPFHCNCMEAPCNDDEEKRLLEKADKYQRIGTCAAFMRLEDDWENEIRNTVYWQAPHTNPDGTKYMGGCPAQCVTMASVLFCSHGGFITPVTSGQDDTYSRQNEMGRLILLKEIKKGEKVSGKSTDSGKEAREGTEVRTDFATFLSIVKVTDERSPDYYILHHENTYIDENNMIRMRKTPGYNGKDDYYCVAMARGFTTLANEYCIPAQEGDENAGFALQVRLQDEKGEEYSFDVIVAEAKGSTDPNDFFTHNNVVEFFVDEYPGKAISEGGNPSFDKLLGGIGLNVTEVYGYENGAMVTGHYGYGDIPAEWRMRE